MRKELTLDEIRRLNDLSRARSLKLRKSKSLPYLVRESDPTGTVYTIRIVDPSKD